MNDLDLARSEFVNQWHRLKTSIETETGIVRCWSWSWGATITAVALGVTFGYALSRRRREKRS